jgi:hypothetical protein
MAEGWDHWTERKASSVDAIRELFDGLVAQLDEVATAVQIGDIDGAMSLHGGVSDSCESIADELTSLRALSAFAMHPSLAD